MKRRILFLIGLLLILFLVLWILLSSPEYHQTISQQEEGNICVVFGHPDDETMISGTLAMLVSKGYEISVVYVTSGNAGDDATGQGLYGETLGTAREREARQAIAAIGIKTEPLFLRYPDGEVPDHIEEIQEALSQLFEKEKPKLVIGFGPDGITGNWDHRMTGFATDLAFDRLVTTSLLLHIANSNNHSPLYPNGIVVAGQAVDLRVNVAAYPHQRIQAHEAHRTQFNTANRLLYKGFVRAIPIEEFIVARNRDHGKWMEKYFEYQARMNDHLDVDSLHLR